MAKERELQKHTVNLYRGDLDRLAELYPKLDKSVALREILRAHIESIENAIPLPVIHVKDLSNV